MRIIFSIIIPNWNGKKLLEKNLPQVLAAAGQEKAEVIVVDNGSTDGSKEYLKSQILNLKCLFNNKNLGFGRACNQAVGVARGEVVVLLNNDVVPKKDFLRPLKKCFEDKAVFAVSLNEPQFSWAKGEFRNGFLHHEPGSKTKKAHVSLWASGGSAAFSRKVWLELGGFDSLYHPFYWEDLDLSYRAWKRGYRVLWEPGSVVYHEHEATVSRFKKSYVDLVKQRNELLFIWKNITDKSLINEHKRFLVKRVMKNMGYLKVVLAALVKLPQVLARRRVEKKETKVNDKEIFVKFLSS